MLQSNRAGIEAMLRASGFRIEAQPEAEVYLCRTAPVPYGVGAAYPARSKSGERGGTR
jgi:tRNA (mo5U34)-methyltransferase